MYFVFPRAVNLGLPKRDRVVLLCENSIEYVFCYYGILNRKAIYIPSVVSQ